MPDATQFITTLGTLGWALPTLHSFLTASNELARVGGL